MAGPIPAGSASSSSSLHVVAHDRRPERPHRGDVEGVDRRSRAISLRGDVARQRRARRRCAVTVAARSTSRWVSPPASWLEVVTVTCPQRSTTSGWWFASSAAAAMRATKAAAVREVGRRERGAQRLQQDAPVPLVDRGRDVGVLQEGGVSHAAHPATARSALQRRLGLGVGARADVPRDPRGEREHAAGERRARRGRSPRSTRSGATSGVDWIDLRGDRVARPTARGTTAPSPARGTPSAPAAWSPRGPRATGTAHRSSGSRRRRQHPRGASSRRRPATTPRPGTRSSARRTSGRARTSRPSAGGRRA